MQTFNITEAAKLVKKSRNTMYKYIDTGKLSVERDQFDKPIIQLTELIRVFGPINGVKTDDVQNERSVTVKNDNNEHSSQNEIKLLRELLAEKDKRIEDLQNTIKLIEYRSDNVNDRSEKKRGFLAKLFS